jgi:hypothetical protein
MEPTGTRRRRLPPELCTAASRALSRACEIYYVFTNYHIDMDGLTYKLRDYSFNKYEFMAMPRIGILTDNSNVSLIEEDIN